jgi:alkanesulfonate monooxygenase SsuD/methylene tetrahydromethanopterin reductase-like flavin-dependent oxidoreductase (luciferase family)
MTVGVAMAFGTTPVPDIASWATACERAGASSVWLGEAWRELAVPLAATAQATEHAQVAAGVMQIFPAHPVIAALQAVQLQELSGDRFALGLGLGAGFVVERWFGIHYDRPLARAREFIEVVRGAMASRRGEPFSYDGEIFKTRRYRMPFGAQTADVPILLAAVGPRMLELAGEVADGVVLGALHSPEYLAEVRSRLALGAERAGRDPGTLTVHAFVICAADADPENARMLARASLAYSAQYPHYRRRLIDEGFGELGERIAERVRAHDQDAALDLVDDVMLDRFAIAGTPAECRDRLGRLTDEIDELKLTLVPFRIDETEAAARIVDAVAATSPRPATVRRE